MTAAKRIVELIISDAFEDLLSLKYLPILKIKPFFLEDCCRDSLLNSSPFNPHSDFNPHLINERIFQTCRLSDVFAVLMLVA